MHLLLRADSDASIGVGHVMRSLALGRRWIEAGGEATLVGRIQSDRLRQRVADAGIALRALDDPGDPTEDVRQLLAALEGLPRGATPWASVDGYRFGADYHAAIRRRGFSLLVIDDLADLPSYHADIVLNQNHGAGELVYSTDADTRRLLGVRFALLQPEFDKWAGRTIETPPVARRILVTTGGANPHGATALILDALNHVELDDLEITVVVGPASRGSVAEAARSGRLTCQVLEDVRDMAALMASMDLAVSGSGSTCWELAFLGLPAIVVELSENQQGSARALDAAGAAENAGPVQTLTCATLAQRIAALCADQVRRRAMSEAGRRLVDGKGAERVVARMGLGLPPLTLRPATEADSHAVWKLATDPSVRQQSFNQAPISWDTHSVWFSKLIGSPDARLWVMATETELAGQVRYETAGGDAEIGISVAPAFRGHGLAARLLASTWAEACRDLGVGRARGVVFRSNRASADAFREAGFTEPGGLEVIRGHESHVFTRSLAS